MNYRIILQVLVLLLCMLPRHARAQTSFLLPTSRPVSVVQNDHTSLYAIVGLEDFSNSMATKTGTSDWRVLTPSVPLRAFFHTTGINAVSTTSGTRLYLVTTPRETFVSNGRGPNQNFRRVIEPGKLLEFDPDSETWHEVRFRGNTGPEFTSAPSLSVVPIPFSSGVWIAVRDSRNNIWTCSKQFGEDCAWSRVTGAGCGSAPFGPIAANAYPDANFTRPSSTFEVYYITRPSPRINNLIRFTSRTGQSGACQNIGRPPTSPDNVIDPVGIQARTILAIQPNGTLGIQTRVIVATHLRVLTPDAHREQLWVASGDSLATWTWAQITFADFPGVSLGQNNLFWELMPDGDRLWFIGPDGELEGCAGPDVPLGTTTATCSPIAIARHAPSDQRPGVDRLGPAIWAADGNIYTTGTLGGDFSNDPAAGLSVTYLYTYNIASQQWQNHLAPRRNSQQLPVQVGHNYGEYSADEFYGNVVFSSIDATDSGITTAIWRSSDDGNSWVGPETPFGPTNGDENVSFDAAGTAYVTTLREFRDSNNFEFVRTMISHWNQISNSWTTPVFIPSQLVMADRPWFIADRLRPGVLYINYITRGNVADPDFQLHPFGIAQFAYRNPTVAGGGDDAQGWCPSIPLPSATGCGHTFSALIGDRHAGCWVAQSKDDAGNDSIWVSVADDQTCIARHTGADGELQLPPGHSGFTSYVGIRQVFWPDDPNRVGPHCVTPILGEPECVAYIRSDITGNLAGRQRRWGSSLSASDDENGRLVLAFQSYHDLLGNPCNPHVRDMDPSNQCRSDVLLTVREPANPLEQRWCGASCVEEPDLTSMLWVNSDRTTDSSGALLQVEHILPSVVALDYDYHVATWMDFSGSLPGSDLYDLRTSDVTPIRGIPSLPFFSLELPPWPGSAVGLFENQVAEGEEGILPFFGDIQQQAGARLHAHLFGPVAPAVNATHRAVPVTMQFSPASHN